jgi:uncharacterized protein (TIGR03435 family)
MRPTLITIALAANIGVAQSQDAAPRPTFEAVSIKPNTSGDFNAGINSFPRRFEAKNVWLRYLIQFAWNIKDFQLSGGPAWAASDRYNVEATADGVATEKQQRLMVQALLEDRFQLKLHREAHESRAYVLVAAKGGIKLQASKAGTCEERKSDTSGPKVCGNYTMSQQRVDGTAITMQAFATALAQTLQQPVTDQTGFAGTFDVHVEWAPDQSTPGILAPDLGPPDDGGADPNGKSIFTVLQEQLGLKLESSKAPVEFLVIDRLERPSEN